MATQTYQKSGGRIEVDYTYSQNVANNTTTVNVSVYGVRTNSSYYSYTSNGNFRLTIGSTTPKNITWSYNAGNWTVGTRYLIVSNSVSISHDAAGALSPITISIYSTSGLTIFDQTINHSFSLSVPTIPRASTGTITSPSNKIFPLDGVNVSNFNITFNRNADVFFHKVNVKFNDGSANGWVQSNGSLGSHDTAGYFSTSASVNIPANWTNILNDTTTKAGTVSVYTYNGSGGPMVGTFYAIPVTFSIKGTLTPTIAATMTGIGQVSNCYVSGRSSVNVKITASSVYGATIASLTTKIEGKTYTGSNITHKFTSTGNQQVAITAKDSRGRSKGWTATLYINPNKSPLIKDYSASRLASPNTTIQNIFTTDIGSLKTTSGGTEQNSGTVYFSYKTGGGSWSTETSIVTAAPYTSTKTYNAGNKTATTSYEVRLRLVDKLGSFTVVKNVSSVGVPFNIHKDKGSVGINKYASGTYALEVGGNTLIENDITVTGLARLRGGVDVTGGWGTFREPAAFLKGISPQLIPANADLNNLTGGTGGVQFYYCPQDADASTMLNCPTKGSAFSLLVERHVGTKQTITKYWRTKPETWIRNFYNGVWGPWYQVSMIRDDTGGMLIPGLGQGFTQFDGASNATHYWIDGRTVTVTIQMEHTGTTQGFKTPFGTMAGYRPLTRVRFPMKCGNRIEYGTIDQDGLIKFWTEVGEKVFVGQVTFLV